MKMVFGGLIKSFREKSQSTTALQEMFNLSEAVDGSAWLQAIVKSSA
jgi:hypothetical protein